MMSVYDENEEVIPVFLDSVKQEDDDTALTEADDVDPYLDQSWTSVPEDDEADLDYIITTQEGTPLYDSREPDVIHTPKSKPKKRRRNDDSDGRVKRRRRCGECGPCQVKVNCGECQQCLRRSVLKQSCIYRKCVYLRKPNKNFQNPNLQKSVSQPDTQYTSDYQRTENGDELIQDDTAFLERPMVLLSPESPQFVSPKETEETEKENGILGEEDPIVTAPVPSASPDQLDNNVPAEDSAELASEEHEEGPKSEDFFLNRILNVDADKNRSEPPVLNGSYNDIDQSENNTHRALLRERILQHKLSRDGAIPGMLPSISTDASATSNQGADVINSPKPQTSFHFQRDSSKGVTHIHDNFGDIPASKSHSSDDVCKEPNTLERKEASNESQAMIKSILNTPQQFETSLVGKQLIGKPKPPRPSNDAVNIQEDRCSSRTSHSSRRRSSASPASVHSNPSKANPFETFMVEPRPNSSKRFNDFNGPRAPNQMFSNRGLGYGPPNAYPFMGITDPKFYGPRMTYPPSRDMCSPSMNYMRPMFYNEHLASLSNMTPGPDGFGYFRPPSNRPEGNKQSPTAPDARQMHPAALPDSMKLKSSARSSQSPASSEGSRQFSPDIHRQSVKSGSSPHPAGPMHPPPRLRDPRGHYLPPPPGFVDPQTLPSPSIHPYGFPPRPGMAPFPPRPDRYIHPGSDIPYPPHVNPATRYPPPYGPPPDSYPFHPNQPPRLFSPWMPHGIMFPSNYPSDAPMFPPRLPMEMMRPGPGPPFMPRYPNLPQRGGQEGVNDLEPGEVRRFPPSDVPKMNGPPKLTPSPHIANLRRDSPNSAKDRESPPMNDHLRRYLDDVYKNFNCLPRRPSSVPNASKTDHSLSERSSLTDYECEMISIDDFHVSAYIRADGTNSVEIEFDQNSLFEDGRSSVTCDLPTTNKQSISHMAKKCSAHVNHEEIMINGKSFKIGLSGTVQDSIVLKQDLGSQGILEFELPGDKFVVENVILNTHILKSSSDRESLIDFVTATSVTNIGNAYT